MSIALDKKLSQTALVVSLLVVFLIITRGVGLEGTALLWFTDMAWTIAVGAVAWKSWQVSRLVSGSARTAWRFFAYAHVSWFAGILVWDYLELIEQVVTPFPAISDIGFMLFGPLFMVALIRVRYQNGSLSNTLIQVSKLGIFAVSVITIHVIVLSPLINASTESVLYISLALIYPVLYISALVYSLLSLWQCQFVNQRKVLMLIIASLFFHAIAVSVYSYSLLGKNYAAGNYIDVLWLMAFGLMYLAAIQQLAVAGQEKNILLNAKSSLQKLTDALIVPGSMVLLLVVRYLFREDITPETSTVILGFVAGLIFFYVVKELASYTHEESLRRELAESEQRFRDISLNLPGMVYQFCIKPDGSRYFPFVGPGIYDLVGVKALDVMQDPDVWFERVHPDDRQLLEQSILQSYNTMEPWIWSGRMVSVSGKDGWYEGYSVPRKGSRGEVTWNGIVLDATAKHCAEAALKIAYDNMEMRVVERTRELMVEKENAEKASQAKSQFLSHMSHELRTPLNAVIGFSQLLQMGQLNLNQQDSVNEIAMAGQHLLGLVNDLLDLEKIESGKMMILQEPVEVDAIINDVMQLMRPVAAINNITIINECQDASLTVVADNFRLRQVILNLLSNAIKYNREDGTVTISCDTLNGRVRLNVADTGLGIKAENIEKIYEPFDRLGAEAGMIEGTGVGLTISKRLTELMHGEIGVQSEYGSGSVFWISLPAQNQIDESGYEK